MNRELRRVVAAVVLGAILGATGTFAAAGRQLHSQRLANVALQAQLDRLRSEHADLRARLEQLSRRRGAARLVQEVTVSVRYPDPVYRLEIERQAHALLAKLPGTPVDRLDYSLLYHLLQDRILKVQDRRVQLAVRVILGGQDLSVLLSATDLGP